LKTGFRLGKIFGIDIHIDWSWLLIFALVSWSLVSSFSPAHPDWSVSLRWAVAASAALLFFASILAHELAHSIAARYKGMPVRNITLFVFGGISNIQREPNSPFAEFIITIVGPLTSFVLGSIFLVLGAGTFAVNNAMPADLTLALASFGPLATILLWLGSVNILIALFNLIPGFPLDGGRLVRSALWAVTDDLSKATRWASLLGQAVAWVLILTGIGMMFGLNVPFLGTGVISGIWILFIGWFLQNAAIQSYRKVVIQDILEDVPVKRLMNQDVPTVRADLTVQALIDNHILQSDHQAFIVLEGERMVGMVTFDDVRKVESEARKSTLIKDAMTPSEKLLVVAPEEEASDAFNRLQSGNTRQLPVVTREGIVGLLRREDIVRWLQLHSHFG
jgi:Zn-dependent protease/CBS domain-containing protein